MACATLKRSLDWDPYNCPATAGPSQRPAKRLCSNQTSPFVGNPPKEYSPFGDVHPKPSADDIAAYIKEEMRRLHHRRQLHYSTPSSTSNGLLVGQPWATPGHSSLASHDSMLAAFSSSHDHASAGMHSPSREQPLFTFEQVGLICDRLMKEREHQIREEYDKVLSSKLAEQYDTFVKFTYEQIEKRHQTGTTPSYLS